MPKWKCCRHPPGTRGLWSQPPCAELTGFVEAAILLSLSTQAAGKGEVIPGAVELSKAGHRLLQLMLIL